MYRQRFRRSKRCTKYNQGLLFATNTGNAAVIFMRCMCTELLLRGVTLSNVSCKLRWISPSPKRDWVSEFRSDKQHDVSRFLRYASAWLVSEYSKVLVCMIIRIGNSSIAATKISKKTALVPTNWRYLPGVWKSWRNVYVIWRHDLFVLCNLTYIFWT